MSQYIPTLMIQERLLCARISLIAHKRADVVDRARCRQAGGKRVVSQHPARGSCAEPPSAGRACLCPHCNLVAEVQIVQFYLNDSPTVLACAYVFPLDEGAAVCGFEVELSDRVLIGEVREKQEARREYRAAVDRGLIAAILEQDKPDIFRQQIGNIPANSRLSIRITYIAELKVDAVTGNAVFVLPTSVYPRYTPMEASSSSFLPLPRSWRDICLGRRVLASRAQDWDGRVGTLPWERWNRNVPTWVANAMSPGLFSMTMEVEMPSEVLRVSSLTHELTVESPSQWGKDLVVSIQQERPQEASVQVELAADGSGCAMLTLIPEFVAEPKPVEIVFLVDCSGSMRSDFEATRRALHIFLTSLPLTCTFNIFQFGSEYKSLFRWSRSYSRFTLEQARRYVDEIWADMGGTEILKPLKAILGRSGSWIGPPRSRQIFVLTDGEVSNTEEVLEICRKHASTSRIFSVGVGDDVSRHLVQGMARATGGATEFIVGKELKGESETLGAKLINMLKTATLPTISDLTIEWGIGPKKKGVNVKQDETVKPAEVASARGDTALNQSQEVVTKPRSTAPFLPPPLFSKSKFLIYTFFGPDETVPSMITLSAKSPIGEYKVDVPVRVVSSVGNTVNVLGARHLIRDFEEGSSPLHWKREQRVVETSSSLLCCFNGAVSRSQRSTLTAMTPEEDVITLALRDLGTRYGLVSKETSFVAVERWANGRSGDIRDVVFEEDAHREPRMQFKMATAGFAGYGPGIEDCSFSCCYSCCCCCVPSVPDLGFARAVKSLLPRRPPKPSDKVALSELLALQNFNGSFNLSKALAVQLECKLDELVLGAKTHVKMIKDKKAALRIWLGIVFLRTLSRRYTKSERTWQLSAEKAKTWIIQAMEKNMSGSKDQTTAAFEQLMVVGS